MSVSSRKNGRKNYLSNIERFFDFEHERSRSRISKLLNLPSEGFSKRESSFIRKQLDPKQLENKDFAQVTGRPQLRSDVYIDDDDDNKVGVVSTNKLSLPSIIN